MKTKLRKGDEVIVCAGKSKGATGKVKSIDKESNQVYLDGVNIVRRHIKPSALSPDGYVDKERPFHISNVSIVDSQTGKASKIGYKKDENGKKIRFCKSSGNVI